MKKITNNAEETILFAKQLANKLSPCTICLSGDLGAGKTTFTKGFALGLGVKENVTSPTFTIMNEYQGKSCKLRHFDMYRLLGADEAYELGFQEYFNGGKDFNLVEWAENVLGLIKAPYLKISISKLSNEKREIILEEIKWKFLQ